MVDCRSTAIIIDHRYQTPSPPSAAPLWVSLSTCHSVKSSDALLHRLLNLHIVSAIPDYYVQMQSSIKLKYTHTHTHTHTFNGPFSGTTWVSWYHKGKTNLDFTEARDSEWQWRQLGHMQVCTSLQTDNHASTARFSFLQAGCRFCHPTNSVKALRAITQL